MSTLPGQQPRCTWIWKESGCGTPRGHSSLPQRAPLVVTYGYGTWKSLNSLCLTPALWMGSKGLYGGDEAHGLSE